MKIARLLFLCSIVAPVFAQQQFGEIGDLKFVSGETLRDCRVGYRTFGQAILKFLGQ